MRQTIEIVLDASTDEANGVTADASEMEAVLDCLIRFGLVAAWQRQANGSYRVVTDTEAMKHFANLGLSADARAPGQLRAPSDDDESRKK